MIDPATRDIIMNEDLSEVNHEGRPAVPEGDRQDREPKDICKEQRLEACAGTKARLHLVKRCDPVVDKRTA